eukprot:PhF_6_TR9172/c0_g1_i1/m.14279
MFSQTSISLRFYLPRTWNRGGHYWNQRPSVYGKNQPPLHMYQRIRPPDPIPYPDDPVNTNFTKRQIITNPIVGIHGVMARKASYGNNPPPKGIAMSWTNYDDFMYKYFPDVECTLVLDSVLNTPNHLPMFLFPPDVSRPEIKAYLQNLYGINGIRKIYVRNFSGTRYKNELGSIRKKDAQKAVWVMLEQPVHVQHKSVKEDADKEPEQQQQQQQQ